MQENSKCSSLIKLNYNKYIKYNNKNEKKGVFDGTKILSIMNDF